MKKLMIFAASAAAVLAVGCAKNEVIQSQGPGDAVSFGVYNGQMATKAVSTTTYGQINTNELLRSSVGFGVFGFFSDNSIGSNDFTDSPTNNFKPNYMYNQKVTYSTKWEYSPIKYWPNEYSTTAALSTNEDKLSFVAYAPYATILDASANPVTISDGAGTPAAADEGIISVSKNDATGDPTLTFKVPAASDKQIDLLYSDAATTNLTKQAISGTVNFTFKHALSNLSIYPVAVVDASSIPAGTPTPGTDFSAGTTITVNSLTIAGSFNQSGTLNLRTGEWSGLSGTTPSVSYSPASPLDVTNINDKAEADAAGPRAEFMFIPTSSKTYTVTIDYDVTYDDAESGLAADLVVKNVIHKDITLTFEKGKKMKLYIGLGMTSVTFSAEVADWTAASDQTIWLPVNTD